MTAVLVGLSTLVLVELLKDVCPWALASVTKRVLGLLVAGVLVVFLTDLGVKETILVGAAAAGSAAVLQELVSTIGAIGDHRKQEVMLRAGVTTRRRRP